MEHAQNLNTAMYQSIGGDKWIPANDELSYIRCGRRPPGSGKLSELTKGLEEHGDDLEGSVSSERSLIILMNGVEIAFSFLSQYYAQHVLPT